MRTYSRCQVYLLLTKLKFLLVRASERAIVTTLSGQQDLLLRTSPEKAATLTTFRGLFEIEDGWLLLCVALSRDGFALGFSLDRVA